MQAQHSVLALLLAVLVFQVVPGPGTLTIVRVTAHHGLRAGFSAVTGTLLGGMICLVAGLTGMEALFRGQPVLTDLLKVAGAAYLGWMGWRLIARRTEASAAVPRDVSLGRHLRTALAVSLTNPKVILFYFALLPLFVRPPVTPPTLATVIGCVLGVSFAWQALLVLAGHSMARRLGDRPKLRRALRRVAGLAFLAFAARVLVA